MVTLSASPRSHCPINFGLEIFGDKWTLLVLRDLLLVGKRTFKEFLASEERISTNILADRLDRLQSAGIVAAERSSEDTRQIHYAATAAGRALLPILVEIAYWGATYDPDTAAPDAFVKAYRKDRAGLLAGIAEGRDPKK